jgi:hypothetical protein
MALPFTAICAQPPLHVLTGKQAGQDDTQGDDVVLAAETTARTKGLASLPGTGVGVGARRARGRRTPTAASCQMAQDSGSDETGSYPCSLLREYRQ